MYCHLQNLYEGGIRNKFKKPKANHKKERKIKSTT